MARRPKPRFASALAPLILAAGCDTPTENACRQYAAQFKALKEIEAEETLMTLGDRVRRSELVWNPGNIARATREVEPRCNALPKEQRACVDELVPVVAEYLAARDVCEDQACRNAAGESAKAKGAFTGACKDVVRGLNCVVTEDCAG